MLCGVPARQPHPLPPCNPPAVVCRHVLEAGLEAVVTRARVRVRVLCAATCQPTRAFTYVPWPDPAGDELQVTVRCVRVVSRYQTAVGAAPVRLPGASVSAKLRLNVSLQFSSSPSAFELSVTNPHRKAPGFRSRSSSCCATESANAVVVMEGTPVDRGQWLRTGLRTCTCVAKIQII